MFKTTRRLVAALQDRELSARELLEQSIERIEAHDRSINAVVVRDFDHARQDAAAADAALARGERRPLLGIPMTVKEAIDVAGLPTRTPSSSGDSGPRAPSSWARPTCRCSSPIGRPTTRSTA